MNENNDTTTETELPHGPAMDASAPPPDLVSTPSPVLENPLDIDDNGHPDAVEAVDVVHRGRMLRMSNLDAFGGRRVEWVRPSDLLAQQSARLAGRGLDFQASLLERAHSAGTTRIRDFVERARRLPPLSAFGRVTHDAPATVRSGVRGS